MLNCECLTWATTDFTKQFFGNGHNPECRKFTENVQGLELLKDLIKGIEEWSSYEDGIPDCLWESYKKAVFITTGKILDDKKE